MVGQERDIINHEFSDMEEIDTKKSVKHDYKDKTRKRKKLEKKEEEGVKKVQIWVREETLVYEQELTKLQIELLKLQNHVKERGYENFDENYKKALEKEKNLNLDDEKNVLYVALTRAKNNLIVFKKEKSSVFDILNIKAFKFGNLILSEAIQIKNSNKKIDYKPLNLGKQDIKSSKDNIVNSDILKSKYFGDFFEYLIGCGGITLKMHTSRHFEIGDEVSVRAES